jgi:signal transduction histidine kinase
MGSVNLFDLVGILDLRLIFSNSILTKNLNILTPGDRSMRNPARDLDLSHQRSEKSRLLQNHQIATESSIDRAIAIPIFSEATAQAIRLTEAPVAILSTIDGTSYKIASITGLDKLAGVTDPGKLRTELTGLEYCHNKAIGGTRAFINTDFQTDPILANSPLCQVHGVQAYLGVSIVTAAGDILGAISILDFVPSQFTDRDLDILQLVSQLAASEFERACLSQAQLNRLMKEIRYQPIQGFDDPAASSEHNSPQTRRGQGDSPAIEAVRPTATFYLQPQPASAPAQTDIQFQLLAHLGQELRTPLTSILGMSRVLQQEIYGTLQAKQKDYLGIIHNSGLELVDLVDQIVGLGTFDRHQNQLTLKSVDLELLCQLAVHSLESLITQKQQRIKLDLTRGSSAGQGYQNRLWILDKDKVRQIIYYLSLSLIQASIPESEISIRLANSTERLELQITTSDPQAMLVAHPPEDDPQQQTGSTASELGTTSTSTKRQTEIGHALRVSLGLSLSQTLAAIHGGTIQLDANGCGYQLSLPLILTERG